MLSQYLIDFYNGWTQKANEINGNDLSSIYDRFITSFIVYNNLYNQVPKELVSRGVSLPNRLYDSKKATDYVVRYIGGTDFIQELEDRENAEDINKLIRIIDEETFHIKLNHEGEKQRSKDLEILSKLRSSSKTKKAIGILQVIYYVRCNMFHGNKMFIEYQRSLIVPLTNILTNVNIILYKELRK